MIGEELKKKREEKGLTFDNIYEETGILKEHIEALENDEFLHFPNKVYARSFLRDYANYLCLDTYNLLREFEEVYTKLLEEYKPEPVEIDVPEELPTGRTFVSKTTGMFIVFVVLCVLAFFIGKYSQITDNPEAENTTKTMVPVNEKPDVVVPKEAPKVVENKKVDEALKEGEKVAEKEIAKAKEFNVVTVYAHRNLWVKIKVDNKSAYEGTIKAGANLEFKVKNNIQLRGGEPSACQINVDGKSIGKLGQPGKPFDLTLTPKTMAIVKQ